MPKFEVLVRQCAPWMFVIFLSLSLHTFCCAQASSATLSVDISDPSGALILDATLVLKSTETNQEQHATSGRSGSATFSFLRPGRYSLSVTKETFSEVAVENIELNVGDKRQLRLVLKVGSTEQTVSVDGSGSTINTTDGTVSTVIDRQFVQNIPLNGRSFQSLMTLAPGTVQTSNSGEAGAGYGGEITVNGQRTEGNYFTVDGVSANTGAKAGTFAQGGGFSGSLPGETALGTTQSIVSIDALQEFRATTSTYSAEYGRTPGGQFSFVTRSGTNNFHGSGYDYFRNEALDANNWFNGYTNSPALRKPPERQNDFGGTLGGPVLIPRIYDGKNRTFFFFSYEGLRLQTPQAALALQVPSIALRQSAPVAVQPALNAFPIPNGQDLGNGLGIFELPYSNPSTLDSISIRGDHEITPSFKVFARYAYSPSSTSIRNTHDLALITLTGFNNQAITIGATNVFRRTATNDFRFNYTSNNSSDRTTIDSFGGATPTPNLGQAGAPTYSHIQVALGFGGRPAVFTDKQDTNQHQLNITNTTTYVAGSHSFKWGVDYRRLVTPVHPLALTERVNYATEQLLVANSASISLFASSVFPLEPIYTNLSAFLQDEWKASKRLSLSLGLRWELNPPPGDAYGNRPYTLNQISDLDTAQLAPKGTSLWKTTYGNFAPRFGAAYRLNRSAVDQLVLRGGVGVFYDTGASLASQGLGAIGYYTSASFRGASFPLNSTQLVLSQPSLAAPYSDSVYAYDPHFRLPYSLQWNASLEQSLGPSQAVTLSYVGSSGQRLLYQRYAIPTEGALSSYGAFITTNGATSNYHSLQAQYQRALTRGLQVLASYTWSHSIDDLSSNFNNDEVGLIRGNSDFDVRHNLQIALTYDVQKKWSQRMVSAILNNWSVQARISTRSALPVDVYSGQALLPDGTYQQLRADLEPNVPVYLSTKSAPGGRAVNFQAFAEPTTTEQAAGDFGNSPRNFLRDFPAAQTDFGLQRWFPLRDAVRLQIRAEAFNIFNHPMFSDVDNYLPDGQGYFGRSQETLNSALGGLNPLYQIGGPRSLQLALRVEF